MLQSAISSGDMATVNTITAGAAQAGGWASLVLFLVFAYPIYALCVKRRHDRNSNGLDVVIYLALVVVLLLVQALGLGMSPTEVPGVGVLMMPTPLYSVLGAISGIFGLYLLVVMGFLKGTPGPNNYGPDPLGGN